jgi:hypothetical protein
MSIEICKKEQRLSMATSKYLILSFLELVILMSLLQPIGSMSMGSLGLIM